MATRSAATGSYERLVGRIEFALDPAAPHNARIVDLEYAPRGADGRVHFSADLHVLQPTDPAKGNGVLLFEAANRGNRVLGRFNNAGGGRAGVGEFGDGLLMRDGYTLVAIGWELGLAAPNIGVAAPPVTLPSSSSVDAIEVDVLVDARATESFLVDASGRPPVIYPPADLASPADRLTVRDLFWDEPVAIHRDRWRFAPDSSGVPKLQLDGGFDPGRWYRVTYRPSRPVVAGVGLAAFRDAASAFRYRSDLPVHGRATYLFGISQTGRFVRQFLYDGFNVDESGRRVFDAAWAHIAGAARGSFNERFAARARATCSRRRSFRSPTRSKRTLMARATDCCRVTQRISCRRSSTPIRRSSIGQEGGPRHSRTRASTERAISSYPTTSGCICWPGRSTAPVRFRPRAACRRTRGHWPPGTRQGSN